MQTAVEERSWSTLHRLYRFESHHFVLPDRGIPRAFAVDATNKRLYVAYQNRPMMEVFCLP
jgi:6-phosphogluconolactonase (cycloisomerase 2 family)